MLCGGASFPYNRNAGAFGTSVRFKQGGGQCNDASYGEARTAVGQPTLENFQNVHEKRLAEHPFVDHSTPDTLRFGEYELRGERYFVLWGEVYCHRGVIVEVTKYYESRVLAGRVQIRGFSYRYNAHVRGGHNILRYDNGHVDAPDEFHRHVFDPATGDETERRIITRYELPVFSDILTEIQELVEGQTQL